MTITPRHVRRDRSVAIAMAALLLCVPALPGCGPRKVTVEASPALERHQIRRMVVVPFQRLTTPQILERTDPELNAPRGAKRSDISLAVPPSGERLDRMTIRVPEDVPERVTEVMYRKLQERGGLEVLSPADAQRVIQGLGAEAQDWPPDRLGQEVARRLKADAALVGKVLIYRERGGSKWGGDPAAVGFEVQLVAPDGTVLWSANYYEKQRPINEDLPSLFERGIGFLTADELVEYGANKIVRKFPFGEGHS